MNKKDEALRQRRYMQNEAITYARNGNWEAAIDSSRQLLSSDPNDIETLNRLAKAYFENGELDNAEQTYQRVLEISEHNPIARRMVGLISRTRSAPAKTREFVDMRMFAIETGKSTLTSLHIDTDAEISLVPGEKLTLRANTQPVHYDGQKKPVPTSGDNEISAKSYLDDAIALDIYDCNDVNLGRLEPRLAARLIRFMKLGNEYTAAVLSLNEKRDQIQIVIRESHRSRVDSSTKTIGALASMKSKTISMMLSPPKTTTTIVNPMPLVVMTKTTIASRHSKPITTPTKKSKNSPHIKMSMLEGYPQHGHFYTLHHFIPRANTTTCTRHGPAWWMAVIAAVMVAPVVQISSIRTIRAGGSPPCHTNAPATF